MNSESSILTLPPPSESDLSAVPPDQHSSQSEIENQNSKIETPVHPPFGTGNRGNGFVARLPKAIRDQLNNMILDGVSYPEIIQRLGEPAKHLNPGHLKEWKKRGHQDWLLQQNWLAER